MTTQPEALQLADTTEFDRYPPNPSHKQQVATELRRLHESNIELLAALKESRKIIRASSSRNLVKDWDIRATAAIAKAEGDK